MNATITSNTTGLFIHFNDFIPIEQISERDFSISGILFRDLDVDGNFVKLTFKNKNEFIRLCATPVYNEIDPSQRIEYIPVDKLNGIDTTDNATLHDDLKEIINPS